MTQLRTGSQALPWALRRISSEHKSRFLKVFCVLFAFCNAAVIAAHSQTFQTVVAFNQTDGAVPVDVLVPGANGDLYGTTQYGGRSNFGTVFQLTTNGTLTTLYNFCSKSQCVDGSLPDAGLVLGSDGNFYGTTFWGGSKNQGTVFKISPSGSLTTLYSFCALANCADGANPHAGLAQGTDGNFYGTAAVGGSANSGVAFKITPSGALTTLYSFCSLANCDDGAFPKGGLLESNGNFYGTTSNGGVHQTGGTVFQLTSGGELTTLHSFCSQPHCADGEYPYASLAQGSDGNFYGTTSGSSPNTEGTIFRITPSGVLTTLYSFCSLTNCTDGEFPYGGVVEGTDHNLYGTTELGGTAANCPTGCGTLFRLSPSGVLTTLYNFCSGSLCADGSQPVAGVVQVGNTFFGTTSSGGSCSGVQGGCGTVFSWSPDVPLPPTLNPTSLNFNNQAIDTTSSTKFITLKNVNVDYSILDINSIMLAGSKDFAISANTCGSTLGAGLSCTVSLTYTPTVLGMESATLEVADNAPDSPQTAALSGTGVAQATVTPTSITFPNTRVGSTSKAKNVTLKNNLSTTLSGISYTTAAPFAVSGSTCGTTLPSKASCIISVTFSPTTSGQASGTLSVKDSANNSPQTVSLTGTGVD